MSRKNKTVIMAQTQEGFQVRAWLNRKTGVILPTNWKQQAGTLARPAVTREVKK